MTLQIIGFPRSNFVRTCRMAAIEKGVPHENVEALPHSDEVRAINPLGLIPVMRHGDLAIPESIAITRYIDTAFEGPALVPVDPLAAAPVNRWIGTVAVSVDQLLMRNYVVEYIFHKDDDGNVVRDKIDRAIRRFPRMFAMLDEAVAPGHLGGAAFSLADCFLMPILAAVQLFPEGREAVAGAPRLAAYFDKVAGRDSFTQTQP